MEIEKLVLTTDGLIHVMEISENYLTTQERLSLSIRNGLFQIALACRDNRSVFTVDDIRPEFDATATIRDDGALRFAKGDDIQLLCGLPPPALRRARDNFRSAIREALDLSILAQELIKQTKSGPKCGEEDTGEESL
jgi:hypothetical protein